MYNTIPLDLKDNIKYTSSGDLVWTTSRGNIVKGSIAGTPHKGTKTFQFNNVRYQVPRVVWYLHHGEIPSNLRVSPKDGNAFNTRIENLELTTHSEITTRYRNKEGNQMPLKEKNRTYKSNFNPRTINMDNINAVNVGQYGPSYDTVQDWRSVFEAAKYVDESLQDLDETKNEVNDIKSEADAAVQQATNAVNTALQINQQTITNTEEKWNLISAAQVEVDKDANVASAAKAAAEKAADDAEAEVLKAAAEVSKAQGAANQADSILNRVEDIDNSIKAITARGSSLSEGTEATASFDPKTGVISIGIPTRVSTVPGQGVTSLAQGDGPPETGPVVVTATGIGALPITGGTLTGNLSLGGTGKLAANNIEITAPNSQLSIRNNTSGSPKWVIESSTDGKLKVTESGEATQAIMDKTTGNLWLRGTLSTGGNIDLPNKSQVKSTSTSLLLSRTGAPSSEYSQIGLLSGDAVVYSSGGGYKQIYHEGNKPSVSDLGVYTKAEVDSRVSKKANLGPSDGKLYGWVGSTWTKIANSVQELTALFPKMTAVESKASSNTTRITALENKPAGKWEEVYKGSVTNVVSHNDPRPGIYTIQVRFSDNYCYSVTLLAPNGLTNSSNDSFIYSSHYTSSSSKSGSVYWWRGNGMKFEVSNIHAGITAIYFQAF